MSVDCRLTLFWQVGNWILNSLTAFGKREPGVNPERTRRCNPAVVRGIDKGTLAAQRATVVRYRNGKVAARAGEPEDLPGSD